MSHDNYSISIARLVWNLSDSLQAAVGWSQGEINMQQQTTRRRSRQTLG